MSKLVEIQKFGKTIAMRRVRVRRSGGADTKYYVNTIITIPKEVLKAMHLKPGMKVIVETDGEQIRISKVES
jgi:AbrB family looped-hinge helix DNA binding protein